jgi:hypothetical protein
MVWQVARVQVVTEPQRELVQDKTTVRELLQHSKMVYAEEKCTGKKKRDDSKYGYS